MTSVRELAPTQQYFEFSTGYPLGFFRWLEDNGEVWQRFEIQALKMARVRKHYSARTLIEVLRWYSDLKDTDKTFKLNNNIAPGLARLFMEKHGKKHPHFFQLGEQFQKRKELDQCFLIRRTMERGVKFQVSIFDFLENVLNLIRVQRVKIELT